MSAGTATLPLRGITVVALEQAVALPYCTFLLGELGAEVIKIERLPYGDVIRGWDDAARGFSTGYVWVNSNKSSVAVDLKTPEGRQIVTELVAKADVFAENFAPGVVSRLGIDFEALSAVNPSLVYCSLSGYGQTGPYANTKAYDLLIQGESGLLNVSGTPDEPAKVGIPITDLVAGSNAVIALIAALFNRTTDSPPQYLDIAMLDSMMLWLGYYPHHVWHHGQEPERTGMHHQYITPYGPYRAGDGTLVNLAVADDRQWKTFCLDVLDAPELYADERFDTVILRHRHRQVLRPLIEERMAGQGAEHWFTRLEQAGIPHGRVRTIGETLEHPQVIARGLKAHADSSVGELPVFRAPFGPGADRQRRVPDLGDSTATVLTSLGYAQDDIQRLRDTGVVG